MAVETRSLCHLIGRITKKSHWLMSTALLVLIDAVHGAETTAQDVLDAWRNRERLAQTLQVTWKEEHRIFTESLQLPDSQFQAVAARATNVRSTENSLLLHGRRVRITEKLLSAQGSAAVGKPLRERVTVSDGITVRGLGYFEGLDHPQGGISEEPIPHRSEARYHALLVSYRPLDPQMRLFDPAHFVLTARNGIYDGRKCIIGEVTEPGSLITRRLWIDPASDFFVVRLETLSKNVLTGRLDLSIEQHEDLGWVITGWTRHSMSTAGMLLGSTEAEVVKTTFQPEISDTEFEIEFPVGTRYFDHRVASKKFIVQADDPAREVTTTEIVRGATQADLLATKTGEGALPQEGRASLYALAAVVSVGLAAFWVFRRRRATAGTD